MRSQTSSCFPGGVATPPQPSPWNPWLVEGTGVWHSFTFSSCSYFGKSLIFFFATDTDLYTFLQFHCLVFSRFQRHSVALGWLKVLHLPWLKEQKIEVMYQTQESFSSGYPNTEKWVEKMRHSWVFLTDFEVFGCLMKHSLEFLIWLLKPCIFLKELQSTSSYNFMPIKIQYPKHCHGSEFLCSLFMNY